MEDPWVVLSNSEARDYCPNLAKSPYRYFNTTLKHGKDRSCVRIVKISVWSVQSSVSV